MQLSEITNIVLVGPMASGKTSIGKQIAYMLGAHFCDTDHLIEQQQQRKIASIFETEGEQAFRTMEAQCLQQLQNTSHHIIATGGGVVLNEQNHKILRSIGAVVFLNSDTDTIMIRTAKSKHRPLLNRPDKREFITTMLDQRRPIYEALADVSVESHYNLSKGKLANLVLEQLAQCTFEKRDNT